MLWELGNTVITFTISLYGYHFSINVNPRTYLLLFFAVSAILAAMMFVAPLLSPYASFIDLDGRPGVLDHRDLWSEQDILTMILYGFGDMVCHQEMARTVILNGSEMPVCIRDLGLLLGFSMGCAITAVRFGDPLIYRNARVYVIVSFLLIFTDWLIQRIFSLNIPLTRLITGLLAGAGFSLIIYCWLISVFYKVEAD